MKFNLVEGQSSRLSEDDFEEFKQDYLYSELTTQEVRDKWGLSKREYSRQTKKIREKYGLRSRPINTARHFYRQGNSWHIIKTKNKQKIHYGALPCERWNEEDMFDIVKQLKAYDWDYNKCRNYLRILEAIS